MSTKIFEVLKLDEKRDLSVIKTDKLIELEIKLLRELSKFNEYPERPRSDEEIILQHGIDRYERDTKESQRINAEKY